MNPPASRQTGETAADITGPELVFFWQKFTSSRWRIGFFLTVAAAVHVGFFYLFRVVYPQPARSIPSPQQITVLSPSNPVARQILAQVADRVSGLVAGEGRSAELTDHSTRFVPSFKDFELTLRIPPENRKPAELPALSLPGESIFPPLAVASPNSVTGNRRQPTAVVTLSGALSGCQILRGPAWNPDTLASLPERQFRFSAGFDRRGRPVFILPLHSPGNPDSPETVAALTAALKTLRLKPREKSASGTLEVTW